MSDHFAETLIFLSWLLVPVVAYFVYVLFRFLRRGKDADGESPDAET